MARLGKSGHLRLSWPARLAASVGNATWSQKSAKRPFASLSGKSASGTNSPSTTSIGSAEVGVLSPWRRGARRACCHPSSHSRPNDVCANHSCARGNAPLPVATSWKPIGSRSSRTRWTRDTRLYDWLDADAGRATTLFDLFSVWRQQNPRQNFQVGIFERTSSRLCGCTGLRRQGSQKGQPSLVWS